MKIRQAPVADLMKYVDELYADKERNQKQTHILEIINKYYCSITNHKTIMPIGGDFMNDWCDLNWSPVMENCPNCPGIIIYKNNKDGSKTYGLIYHSGYITTRAEQTNYMGYYDISKTGHITSHTYLADDWDGWGAPTRFFSFNKEDYQDSSVWTLGERVLKKHSFGHDVRQLQSFLQRAHPEVIVDGYFDNSTLNALHLTQEWCNISKKNEFSFDDDGKKIVNFLCGIV